MSKAKIKPSRRIPSDPPHHQGSSSVESAAKRRSPRKPESEAQRTKRLQALAVQLADREHQAQVALAAATGALPRARARAHVLPLDRIEDEARRLEVWKARIERLEALLEKTARKRETRAKIVLGAALLAEAQANRDDPLLARFVEILDRRVARPRDRLALSETLGLPLAPIRPAALPELPDFEALLGQTRDGDEDARPGDPP